MTELEAIALQAEAQSKVQELLNAKPGRPSVCEEAHSLVNGDRDADYGDSTVNLTRIAGIAELLLDDSEWEAIQARQFSATIIAKVLIATKLARERNKHKRDNLVDLCGYAELLDRCYK